LQHNLQDPYQDHSQSNQASLGQIDFRELGSVYGEQTNQDNIILVQEAIHTSRARKDKGMVIKLDMENAFDRIKHSFLFFVLHKFGFSEAFIDCI
jgi:hypothetical protein